MTAFDDVRVGRMLSLDEYRLTKTELALLLGAAAHQPNLDLDAPADSVDALIARCWRELIAADTPLADHTRRTAIAAGGDVVTAVAIAHLFTEDPTTQESWTR